MTITPLGDQAAIVYFADESTAVAFAATVRSGNPAWLFDVVPAYASVGVFFDADQIQLPVVVEWLKATVKTMPRHAVATPSRRFVIPVCYDRQLDLANVADVTGLTSEQIITLHTTAEFTVYAIGFVPGFPYMGYLPEPLRGVPRLATPRLRVEPGSVGLTGKQTAIYPLPRPGGWNIIGRTPLTIVDVADGYFPLRVGDHVQFQRIDEAEYTRLEGERLPPDSDHPT